jgi:AraC family transcriptional regulator
VLRGLGLSNPREADEQQLSAIGAMARVLDRPPALADELLRGHTRRWTHGTLHDRLPQIVGHVVMTFYGAAQEIRWREGAERVVDRTRVKQSR